MTTVITYTDGTITPTLVDGYTIARESRNIEHIILGRASSDFTLRPAGLRAGTLRLLFPLEADATAAEAALSTAELFSLVTDDRDGLDMSFVVVGGGVELALDDQTRSVWIVSVTFQETTP